MTTGGNRTQSTPDDPERSADAVGRPISADVELEVESLGSFDGAAERSAAEAMVAGTAITVLVVDDDADMRRYVRRALRHMEARVSRVVEAADGEEALTRLGEVRVGLVISDVVMQVIDGYTLSRTIRETVSAEDIPILLITGEGSVREAADRAREAGAQGVLGKPFNAHDLCRAVEAVLDTRGKSGDGR